MNHCLQIWNFWFFLQCSFLMLFVPFTLMGHQCVIARKCRVTLSADKSGIVLAGRFGIGRYWNEKGTFLRIESKKLMNTFQKLKSINECIFFFQFEHTIRKVKFFSPKIQFHEFFTQIFFDNFSGEIKIVNS